MCSINNNNLRIDNMESNEMTKPFKRLLFLTITTIVSAVVVICLRTKL